MSAAADARLPTRSPDGDETADTLAPELAALGVGVVWIEAQDLADPGNADAFYDARETLLEATLARYRGMAPAVDPHLAGYRALHAALGIRSGLTPSPESLVGALLRHGTLRRGRRLVDLYCYVALKHRVSAGGHDLEHAARPVRLALTTGTERFVALGRERAESLPAGEYAYVDAAGEVLCRLECRQAAHSCLGDTTRNALFILQGNAAIAAEKLDEAAAELCALLVRHGGADEARLRVTHVPAQRVPD